MGRQALHSLWARRRCQTPRSKAEVRLAHAELEGKAKDSGMSKAYAREVVNKMHGRRMTSLPEHSQKAAAKPRSRVR